MSRRLWLLLSRVLGFVVLVAVMAGCQVKVAVDTKVNRDGTGTVSVGVGLDDKAMARAGDLQLDTQVKVDDMRAAGWTVTPPAKGADGLTWLRASKPFANTDELNKDRAEINDGIFKGYGFTRTETDTDTTYRLTGTIDTSKGVAAFSEPDLASKLNGDAFGGQLPVIEAEEGKKVADMVSFDITATVAEGTTKEFHPTLNDKSAVPIDVTAVDTKPAVVQSLGIYALIAVGGLIVIVMLVGVRRRFSPPPR